MKSYRNRLLLTIPTFILSFLTLNHFWKPRTSSLSIAPELPEALSVETALVGETPVAPAPVESHAKITLIAIWRAGNSAIYLDNFFASVALNHPLIDLLFVQFRRKDEAESDCEELASGVNNVREICLSHEDYLGLHADFLCGRWECTGEEREILLQEIKARAPRDEVNSFFRILRPGVFAKWLDDAVPLWGWCDMDVMLGNFERNFPWDIASMFDVFVPGSHIHGDEMLMLLPGHLSIFRKSADLLDQFMLYPNFRSLEAFLTLEPVSRDSEEVEYTNYVFLNPNITFFRGLELVYAEHHLSSPSHGVYGIGNVELLSPGGSPVMDSWDTPESLLENAPARELLSSVICSNGLKRGTTSSTFSSNGFEYRVKLRQGMFPWTLWFPQRFAVDYHPNYSKGPFQRHEGIRYTLRRVRGGPVTERVEPYQPITVYPTGYTPVGLDDPHNVSNSPYLVEGLYNHFQTEKYRSWWSLPERAIDQQDILYVDRKRGLQVWNEEGEVVFDTNGTGKL